MPESDGRERFVRESTQERQQVMSRRLVDALEAERQRLARELHDDIGQSLTLIKLRLQAVRQLPPDTDLSPQIEAVIKAVEHTLERVRALSQDLRPALLDDLGLIPALRSYVQRLRQHSGLDIQFYADPLARLDGEVETACFRIVQEALTNVLRHAQAQHVHVTLRRDGQDLLAQVRDDGVGFDPAAARTAAVAGGSFGVLGMAERAHLVGGELHIESSPGKGCTVWVRFPQVVRTPVKRNHPEVQGKVRVLLAEDHTLVRSGFRALLEQMTDVIVVGEAGDGREALARVAELQPDIVLMDIAMAGLNGLEATARIVRDHPGTRVVMLSMHADQEYVAQALRAGAAGYLLKDVDAEELERALHAVLRDEIYLCPAISRQVIEDYVHRMDEVPTPLERLTPRQREVLQLIAEGRTTQEIAAILGVSVKTVQTHRLDIMERLQIFDIAGLVRFALASGLVASG